jgi:peptidoglycan/xylan/chitin deacetylase (PgdA/CDA1 family)
MRRMPRRVAYLTIDDGPSADMPEKVRYLLSAGVPAIWFCQGRSLEKWPDFAVEAIEKGHQIGNHSYDHPSFSNLEASECIEQIQRTDGILKDVYARSHVVRYRKYFRFPYGDKGKRNKTALQSLLRRMGYVPAPSIGITYRSYHSQELDTDIDWYWTYDVMDWSIHSKVPQEGIDSIEKVLARMDEDDPENGKGLNSGNSAEIVLMHDHEETSPYFRRIVDGLLKKGFSFELPK